MAPVSVVGHDVGLVSVCSLVPWVVSSNDALIFPKDNGEELRILAVGEIPPERSQRFEHKRHVLISNRFGLFERDTK